MHQSICDGRTGNKSTAIDTPPKPAGIRTGDSSTFALNKSNVGGSIEYVGRGLLLPGGIGHCIVEADEAAAAAPNVARGAKEAGGANEVG